MPEICPKCGLPKELCVCEIIAKEGQKIKVKVEKRKFGKAITIIEGINDKEINLKDLAKKLKSKFACGGTVKGNTIELQGNQSQGAKQALVELGFDKNSIE
jgi:translation initiation factor 1